MIKTFPNKLILIGIFLIPGIAMALDFTVAPTKLKINKDDKNIALTLTNNINEAQSFQLTAYKIVDPDNPLKDKETDEIFISPIMFKVSPNNSQMVRIALKDNATYQLDKKAYRISVKELPRKINKEGTHVQFVTEFKLPVIITDQKSRSDSE